MTFQNKSRFHISRDRPIHMFPTSDGNYSHITIQDFKIIESPEPTDEILLRIQYVVPLTGPRKINREDEMMTISEFQKRFFNGTKSDHIVLQYGYSVWILAGITDERGDFFSLDELPHTNNIEYFDISIGYEAHYRGDFDLM